MDIKDPSSILTEDEHSDKCSSIMKAEPEEDNIDCPISMNRNLSQSNDQRLQKFDETVNNAHIAKDSIRTDQNEYLERQEAISAVKVIGKDSAGNLSLIADNENLESSQSTLSIASTDATYGSTSPDSILFGDEQLNEFKDIGDKRESEEVLRSATFFSCQLVDNESHITEYTIPCTEGSSLPKDSFCSQYLDNESHITESTIPCTEGSSLQKDSLCGQYLDNECHVTELTNFGPIQKDTNSLKSPDLDNKFGEDYVPSPLADGKLSDSFKSEEFPFSNKLVSDYPSNFEELSSERNTISEPSFLKMFPSDNMKQTETSIIPYSGGVWGFKENITGPSRKIGRTLHDTSPEEDDWDIYKTLGRSNEFVDSFEDFNRSQKNQKEDKSVRKKVKTKQQNSSKSESLPTMSSEPLESGLRNVGRSLRQMSDVLDHTSRHDISLDIRGIRNRSAITAGSYKDRRQKYYEDKSRDKKVETEPPCDLYEQFGVKSEVKYYAPNLWATELFSACHQIQNAIPGWDTASVLKEVHQFFENNRVEADETQSWEKRKTEILASKYFSDEFCRNHGLMSYVELVALKNPEDDSFQRNPMLSLCRKLQENRIPDGIFIDYVEMQMGGGGREFRSCLCDTGAQAFLFSIENQIGFEVMCELYRKIMKEGISSETLLLRETKALERLPYTKEMLNTCENASQVPSEFSVRNQNNDTDCLSFNQTHQQNIDCPSGNEANMPQDQECAAEISHTNARESRNTSKVASMCDSEALTSATARDEPCSEDTHLTSTKVAKLLESDNEPSVGNDGSRISSENFDSKVDGTGLLTPHTNAGESNTLKVASMCDSEALLTSATARDEPCSEDNHLTSTKVAKLLESDNEPSVGNDGSNISSENFDSKVDGTGLLTPQTNAGVSNTLKVASMSDSEALLTSATARDEPYSEDTHLTSNKEAK